VKDIYVVASGQAQAISLEVLKEVFETEDVEFLTDVPDTLFSLRSGDTRIDVKFGAKGYQLPMNKDLVTGAEETKALFKKAKGFYALAFAPGKPQPSVAVFEALWAARSIMDQLTHPVLLDLLAHKLHDSDDVVEITELEFDIRDHVNLHAVEQPGQPGKLWVHSHGMEKFGVRDVEAFHLTEEDLMAAETFMHELCMDLAFGHGPQLRTTVETSEGQAFSMIPSEEARLNLMGVSTDAFEGHEGMFYTLVSADGRHTLSEVLKPYHDRFEQETPEESEALRMQASEVLPAFKARCQRKGLMEPLTFLVRAPFESHPGEDPVYEDLWVEVLTWEEKVIVGKLVDGGAHTTEWRKGAHVELEEDQVNAVALGRDGKTLQDEDMRTFLLSERPM
jgi:hypothetical protein